MAKIPRVPVEKQITTLSVVKIAIKFSPRGMSRKGNEKSRSRASEIKLPNTLEVDNPLKLCVLSCVFAFHWSYSARYSLVLNSGCYVEQKKE